jgi:glycosyltransferase involved in cell wall biosynthesis
MITLTFIVNTFNNPLELLGCLASLKLQKLNDKFKVNVHVADNSDQPCLADNIKDTCNLFEDIVYHKTSGDCYSAIEEIYESIETDWFCFASSDCYYVPGFAFLMLEASVRYSADFVYCDCVYDPRLHGRSIYSVLNTVPENCWIDKTSFIIKKQLFNGFPQHSKDWRDGALVEELVKANVKMCKAKGVLLFHN